MTAQTHDRQPSRLGVEGIPAPSLLPFLLAANTTIYGGAIVATNSSGLAVPASADPTLRCWGIAQRQVTNGATPGETSVSVDIGTFYFYNSAGIDEITFGDLGSYAYVVDDQTVALTSASDTRPIAGVIQNINALGQVAVAVGSTSPYDAGAAGGVPTSRTLTAGAGLTGGGDLSANRTFDVVANGDGSIVVNANDIQVGVINATQHGNLAGGALHAVNATGTVGFSTVRNCRVVIDTNQSLAAFVGVTGGTAQNGVTCVAGDVVLLVGQTTGAENGPYVVGTVTAGTAPLTRPLDFATGSLVPGGIVYQTGSTQSNYAASQWKSISRGNLVVGTTNPTFYPKNCSGKATLVAGTVTLGSAAKIWMLSAAPPTVINLTYNTSAGAATSCSIEAPSASRTAGVVGTAQFVINAIAIAGGVDAGNTSTVDYLVTNW